MVHLYSTTVAVHTEIKACTTLLVIVTSNTSWSSFEKDLWQCLQWRHESSVWQTEYAEDGNRKREKKNLEILSRISRSFICLLNQLRVVIYFRKGENLLIYQIVSAIVLCVNWIRYAWKGILCVKGYMYSRRREVQIYHNDNKYGTMSCFTLFHSIVLLLCVII